MVIPDFTRSVTFLSQSEKRFFSIKFWLKFKIFRRLKNGIYFAEPFLDFRHAQFQVDISIVDKHIAKNRVRWWRYFFKLKFGASLDLAQITVTFFGILRTNSFKNKHFLFENTNSKNLTICDPRLTWPPSLSLTCMWSDCKMASIFFNSTCKGGYKTCAPCPKKDFFLFWWPFVTWPWLWPVLSMTW